MQGSGIFFTQEWMALLRAKQPIDCHVYIHVLD